MDQNSPFSKTGQPLIGNTVTNEVRASQLLRTKNPPLNETAHSTSSNYYAANSNRPVHSQWKQRNEMTKSYIINVPRMLSKEEVLLIRTVASKLDSSFSINSCSGKEKSLCLSFHQNIQQCVIVAVLELVTGLCDVYKRNYDNNEILRNEVGVPKDTYKSKENPEENPSVNDITIPQAMVNDMSIVNSTTKDQPLSLAEDIDEIDTPGYFERPFSLKGQRHVFLYKCRYSQLKGIIDSCGCWGLRMASLEERWPYLIAYCAPDKATWNNTFRKIKKLELKNFHRKKISDSVKNVDLKRLEELEQLYGRQNACISLCAQSPSTPENPSVSVCGVESFVEDLYNVFIEYHLISEVPSDHSPQPPYDNQSSQFHSLYSAPYKAMYPDGYPYRYRDNDIYFPIMNHPLNAAFLPTMFTTEGFNNDMRDDYNTTSKNPYFDNYAYSQIRQDNTTRPYNLSSQPFSIQDRSHDNPFFLDNEHYFSQTLYDMDTTPFYRKASFAGNTTELPADPTPSNSLVFDESTAPTPTPTPTPVPTSISATTTTTTPTTNETPKLSTANYKEFTPSILSDKCTFPSTSLDSMKSTKTQPATLSTDTTIKNRSDGETKTLPQPPLTRPSIDLSSSYDMSFTQEKSRFWRDDHFESFMGNYNTKPWNDDGF